MGVVTSLQCVVCRIAVRWCGMQLCKKVSLYSLSWNCQGSVAIAGAAVVWLRDNIGIIQSLADVGLCSLSAFYLCIFLKTIYVIKLYITLYFYAFSALWHCLFGVRKSVRPVKIQWWGARVVICLERGAYGQADATAIPKPHHLLPHLNPDYQATGYASQHKSVPVPSQDKLGGLPQEGHPV